MREESLCIISFYGQKARKAVKSFVKWIIFESDAVMSSLILSRPKKTKIRVVREL